jgi:hypothetical protein
MTAESKPESGIRTANATNLVDGHHFIKLHVENHYFRQPADNK